MSPAPVGQGMGLASPSNVAPCSTDASVGTEYEPHAYGSNDQRDLNENRKSVILLGFEFNLMNKSDKLLFVFFFNLKNR